jgi:hypothetical protein
VGVAVLGIVKMLLGVVADYLKIWYVEKGGDNAGSIATDDEVNDIGRLFQDRDDEGIIKAPASSVLYNWPEPPDGDKHGWERFRMAYLKENQLWLQAHMDSLIDGPTTVEFRKLLMDSLANVLNESSVLKLTNKESGQLTADPLEINALPPHEAVVRDIQDERDQVKGSKLELTARLWLVRARFVRYLRETVRDSALDQAVAKPKCETCNQSGTRSRLFVCPQYPVPYVAEQLRIQRELNPLWNMPVWENFFSTFTPACTLCESCATFFAKKDVPISTKYLPARIVDAVPVPCEEVLEQSNFDLPDKPLAHETLGLLDSMLNWAEFTRNPLVPVDDFFAQPLQPTDIPESAKLVIREWLRRVRQQK